MNIDLNINLYNESKLEELISYLVSIYKLEDYVKTLNISDKYHLQTIANYFPTKKELNLYIESIYHSYYCSYVFVTEEQSQRYANLYLLETILHELTHASQTKISEESSNDSLHILVSEGIELGSRSPSHLTIREKFLYNFFHDLILTEKNANCESIKKILDLANTDLFLTMNESTYLEEKLEKYLNYGYNNRSASENYYRARGKVKEYKKIPFNEDYDAYTKRSWGMPIK